MKIAIAFSGMPRSFKSTYSNFIENVIRPLEKKGHSVDIFIHVWENKIRYVKFMNDEGTVKELINLYSPASHRIESYNDTKINKLRKEVKLNEYFDYLESKDYKKEDHKESDFIGGGPQRDNRISHFYGFKAVKEIILEYEKLNDIKYDCIIKNRFDNMIFEPINTDILNDLDNTVYSTMGYEADDKHINKTVNDMFFVGSRDSIIKLLSLYSNLHKLLKIRFDHKHTKPWQPPGLVRHHLVDCKIKIKRFYLNHIVTRRLHKYKALNSVVTGDGWNIPVAKTDKIITETNTWI